MTGYDDFLGLRNLDLSRYRTIVFHGRSGSGKSLAIEFLVSTQVPAAVVVDEITTWRDLCRLRGPRSGVLLVASHVSPWLVRLFVRGPVAVFHTDRESAKIARHFQRNGVVASQTTIDRYTKMFGATYTDADLIMERWPSRNFDESFARFMKLGRIESETSLLER